jgi:hypothetical protein
MTWPIPMNAVVRIEPGTVAVIVIDNPPIDARSMAALAGVPQAVGWARADTQVKALVSGGPGGDDGLAFRSHGLRGDRVAAIIGRA